MPALSPCQYQLVKAGQKMLKNYEYEGWKRQEEEEAGK